jgi:uncharacterized protein YgbK (DUF1537 family)
MYICLVARQLFFCQPSCKIVEGEEAGMALLMGCIADDLTGASDLAGVLVAAGMRTMQTIGIPSTRLPAGLDAVVVALKSRTAPVAEAVAESLAALEWLGGYGCDHVFFKYCSTFDSTSDGNIGPVLDALARACGSKFSIACPAFPANRRTVYQGHLFVGDRLLNESGMEYHPLTPMTDSNLVNILQTQTETRIGLIPLADIRADHVASAADRLMANGIGAAIADAIEEQDLLTLGRFCSTLPLSSGASGLGEGIGRALMVDRSIGAPVVLPRTSGPRAVLAGSCSTATQRQVVTMRRAHPSFQIELDGKRTVEEIGSEACAWFDAHADEGPVLIFSTADPETVARQRAILPNASAVLEEILATVAVYMIQKGLRALIVAGGETSGAVVQRLGIETLKIGPEIDPGIPWTIASAPDTPEMVLALKSGNFGADDFMLKAWDLLP